MEYVSNIFTFDNDSPDPDSNESGKNKEVLVICQITLREYGILKKLILRKRLLFVTGNSKQANSDPSSKGASPFSSMGGITVNPKGITKLLDLLNVHQAPGPGGLNARLLKKCSTQI